MLWLTIAFFAIVISGGQSYGEIEAPSVTWSGFASLREGQIVQGRPEDIVGRAAKSDHVWIQQMDIGLLMTTQFITLPATGMIGVDIAVLNDNSSFASDLGRSRRLNFYPFLSRADLLFNVVEGDDFNLQVDAGYFPYKYNSNVRNLGEYLFRSGTYPQYLINEIDFPMARLMGVRLGGTLWNTMNFDVIVNTNIEWTAIGDVNLSGLFTWKPAPLVEIGVGGSWNSIISVDLDKTTPREPGSEYIVAKEGTTDTLAYNYTFAGQKLMARFALDLKQLFPGADVFGEEDLKLYSEAAILGLINYPLSRNGNTQYDTLWQRIPVMVGLNLPLFRFMDLLSVEVEYFGNPYVNSINSIKFDNVPVPLSSYGDELRYKNIHTDDWKWSVYGKKIFAENFFIMGQVARDHIRWFRMDYAVMEGKEALRENGDWYYTVKFGYSF